VGIGAIQAGYRVRFVSAVTLAQELLQAQQEYRLPRYLKGCQKADLVILDELGYLGLGPGGPLLFQFCAERYERGSLLITTNLEFARWGEVFADAALTAALLDRLTHHVHILLFQGESYRFKESRRQRGDQPPPSSAPNA
jgi:DNA replication protein DnaC